MRLMNHMMRARECVEGKDLNLEILMDFEEGSSREMCEPSSKEMCEPSPREKMMTMMMGSMRMGEKSCNETMMNAMKSSIMEEKLAKKDKMDCIMMGEKEAKEDKMESMMEEKEANESCYTGKMEKASLTRANLDCVCLCLEKAIKLHEMYLRNPEAATSESKMEMMKQMMKAHEYLTGEKMDMDMMDKVKDNESAGKLKEKAEYLSAEKSGQLSSSKMGQYSSIEQSKERSSGGC